MTEFRISQLLKIATEQIQLIVPQLSDGRIQATPDVRTLRYYQSQGIIDKPLRYEGREAIYGSVHLHQLVIIKVLQLEGYRLNQIQRRLAGTTPQVLAKLYLDMTSETSEPPSPTQPSAQQPRHLISAELCPGVFVTIDPEHISSPTQIINSLTLALNKLETL